MQPSDTRLAELIAESRKHVAAMTPAERDAMVKAQAESWARGMAPCKHGDPDWETCEDCRNEALGTTNAPTA